MALKINIIINQVNKKMGCIKKDEQPIGLYIVGL